MGDPMEIAAIISEARKTWTQKDLADLLEVDVKTVSRWETGKVRPPAIAGLAIRQLMQERKAETPIPSENPSAGSFRFIDLFAGIGGIRLGFERSGGTCVFTSEWNAFAQKTYQANFGDHGIDGDITKIHEKEVPDHDVLLAGFPCQPFSIAGVSKKNSLGRAHGFACETQGTRFFDVARIIDEKKPKAFLLENVKNLVSHDKGNTFKIIMRTLQEELGYTVRAKVIDAKPFLPQHRERIFIAGFREDTGFDFSQVRIPDAGPTLHVRPQGQGWGQIHPHRRAVEIPPRLRGQAQGRGQRFRVRPRRPGRHGQDALGQVLQGRIGDPHRQGEKQEPAPPHATRVHEADGIPRRFPDCGLRHPSVQAGRQLGLRPRRIRHRRGHASPHPFPGRGRGRHAPSVRSVAAWRISFPRRSVAG
jgi:DNA-cytosine methyltransferase